MLKTCSRRYEFVITPIFPLRWPESQVNFTNFHTNKWPVFAGGQPWKVIYRRNSPVPGKNRLPVTGSGQKGRFYCVYIYICLFHPFDMISPGWVSGRIAPALGCEAIPTHAQSGGKDRKREREKTQWTNQQPAGERWDEMFVVMGSALCSQPISGWVLGPDWWVHLSWVDYYQSGFP